MRIAGRVALTAVVGPVLLMTLGFNGVTDHLTPPKPPGQSVAVPGPGVWLTAGSMNVARSDPNAVVLRDGRVLVAGGAADGSRSTEIYDPVAGNWQFTGTTHLRHDQAFMVRLADGRVLLAGGDGSRRAGRSGEVYDPATGIWSLAAPLNHPRWGAAAVLLRNGRVLVAGGEWFSGPGGPRGLRSAEVYRPVQDRWIKTTPTAVPHALNFGHQSMVVLRNGDALLAGAAYGDVGFSRRAERYDVGRHVWRPAGQLSSYRTPTLLRLPSGQVLAIAGWTPVCCSPSSVDRYLPHRNLWVQDPRLPGDFGVAGAVTVPAGRLAIGECQWAPSRPCPHVAINVIGTREWARVAPMPDSRLAFATVRLRDGSVLVIGGSHRSSTGDYPAVASVWRYMPTT